MARNEVYRWLHSRVWLRRVLLFEVLIIVFELAMRMGVFFRGYPSIGGEICVPIAVGMIWWAVQTIKADKVKDRAAGSSAMNEKQLKRGTGERHEGKRI